jgi:hypothetical protein
VTATVNHHYTLKFCILAAEISVHMYMVTVICSSPSFAAFELEQYPQWKVAKISANYHKRLWYCFQGSI